MPIDDTDERSFDKVGHQNSLFDKNNAFTRFAAQSEIKSKVDMQDVQKKRSLRASAKLKKAQRNVRKQAKENERVKAELASRERLLNMQKNKIEKTDYEKKLNDLCH